MRWESLCAVQIGLYLSSRAAKAGRPGLSGEVPCRAPGITRGRGLLKMGSGTTSSPSSYIAGRVDGEGGTQLAGPADLVAAGGAKRREYPPRPARSPRPRGARLM